MFFLRILPHILIFVPGLVWGISLIWLKEIYVISIFLLQWFCIIFLIFRIVRLNSITLFFGSFLLIVNIIVSFSTIFFNDMIALGVSLFLASYSGILISISINPSIYRYYRFENSRVPFVLKLSKYNNDNTSCTICLEFFQKDQDVCVFKCSHLFHENCIQGWINLSKTTCPNCNQTLLQNN